MTNLPIVTLPAGRFMINVPGDAEISWGRQGFEEAGPFIQTFSVPTPEIFKAALETEVNDLKVPHQEGGTQFEKIITGDIKDSWFMSYLAK